MSGVSSYFSVHDLFGKPGGQKREEGTRMHVQARCKHIPAYESITIRLREEAPCKQRVRVEW